MLKLGALILVLAVAATQVELNLSLTIIGAGELDLSACPVVFYGREYTRIQMSYNNSVFSFCSPGADPECILLADSQGDRMSVEIWSEPTNVGSLIHQALPLIQSNSSCCVQVALQDETNSTHLLVSLYNFVTEGGLVVTGTSLFNQTGVNITILISDSPSQSHSASKSQVDNGLFLDISACRYSGGVLSRGTTDMYDAETCAALSCSSAAVLSSVSTCQSTEICQSNTGCVPRALVCSVTGSTVIGFFRRVHSVTNQCAYSLVKPQGDSAFNILAGFRERRRQDVMFLDHLILWLQDANVTMYLEQGGRVRVNGQLLQLNATVQLFHNVELSKDQTGVTARIPGSSLTIYFDGNTAHVAGSPTAVEGLCGNPGDSNQTTTLSAEKSTSYSISGCETKYPDISNQTINCTIVTEQCNLILQAPFTACHEFSNPDPYIAACNNTLCNYPTVDGLRCQFLEAYAKSCNLKNIPLGGWKPAASCPADPHPFCLDQHCSHHEFCGEENGETHCLCRAIFASEYRGANSLVIDSCWATDQPSMNGSVRYNLIIDGCPNTMDKTVELSNNGAGTSNSFSFNMFRFTGDKEGVYLHCEVKLCVKQKESCVKTCVQGRRRRSARRWSADANLALISMSWSQ